MTHAEAPSALACLLLVLAASGGCAHCPDTFLSRQQLVAEHNANAAAVPRLWARATIAVTIAYEEGRTFTWGSLLGPPNGYLLLSKGRDPLGPHDFVLAGLEAGVRVFKVGTNVEQGVYYFWGRYGREGGAWWGRQALAGATGVEGIPIDPSQLLSLLGICELPSDFTRVPTVLVAMDRTPCCCAYVVSYVAREPVTKEILFRRETYFRWSDTDPPRPFKVNLFDNAGQRVLTATMGDYQAIERPEGAPAGPAPVMPTRIRIDWNDLPGKEVIVRRIDLALSRMRTAERGDPAFESRFFDDDGLPPTGVKVRQVDAHLDAGARG